jgi:hypothetical protein
VRIRTSLGIGIGVTLANFSDTDLADIPGDMVGTANWGDGSNLFYLTISGKDGTFTVHGWHQFAKPGPHTVLITVKSIAENVSYTFTTTLQSS